MRSESRRMALSVFVLRETISQFLSGVKKSPIRAFLLYGCFAARSRMACAVKVACSRTRSGISGNSRW
jgi:hypothetical protein